MEGVSEKAELMGKAKGRKSNHPSPRTKRETETGNDGQKSVYMCLDVKEECIHAHM